MLGRSIGLAAVALACAAAPAGAQTLEIHGGPLKVQGFDVTIDATAFQREATVSISFVRSEGGVREEHVYGFTKRVKLRAGSDLRTGRLVANLGAAYGEIDLRLTRPGALGRIKPDEGCFGPRPKRRSGRLRGMFVLAADNSFFGIVRSKSMPGSVTRTAAGVHCTGGAAPMTPEPLNLFAQPKRFTLRVDELPDGRSRQELDLTTSVPPATHTLVATGPAGSFTGASDQSSATLTGAAPAFSGSLRFTATKHFTEPFPYSEGRLDGDLVANFAALGPKRFPVPSLAALSGS